MATLPGSDHTLHALREEVEGVLRRIGVMYRIFGRSKSRASIEKKVRWKGYGDNGRLLQDLIGIRVVVYFAEDCDVVRSIISSAFDVADEAVDVPNDNVFGPRRLNLVLRAGDGRWNVDVGTLPIDRTFELQIRTVLSEGWHEVEHDLRYKCSDDWADAPAAHRTLNGALGALETAEWAMVSLFDDLAYKHYRGRNWEAMLRHKFRLRIQDGSTLGVVIADVFNRDKAIAKAVWRADRRRFLTRVADARIDMPWTFDNLVFLVLAVEGIAHGDLLALRPNFIRQRLEAAFGDAGGVAERGDGELRPES